MMKLMMALMGALLVAASAVADSLNPMVLNGKLPDQYAGWDLALSGKESPWFAYYGADNTLYVRRPDGAELGLGAADRPRQQSGLAMTPVDDGLALLWRDKLPRKHLYLISKLDPTGIAPPPVVVAGEESEPLTRLKLARDGDVEYLLWLGEKGDPDSKEKYHLYFRTVEQGGKALSPVERVMPGRYPAWIVDRDVIPVFSWMTHEGQLAMTQRVFDRAKKNFGPVTKITDAPPIAPVFEAFKSGERWFLVWLGQYGEGADPLLEGVYSDDKGQTWKRFAIEDLRGLDVGGLSVVADDKGHLLIALDGNRRLRDPDSKNNVYVVRSTDNGSTWQKPQTVRPDDLRLTRAQYPVLALGAEPGTVLLAWEDWRGIRPNVYVSYSRDYGATWEPAVPLARPGVWNLGLDPQPRVLLNRGDRFFLVAEQYRDDSLLKQKDMDYVLYAFTWDEARRGAEEFKMAETQSRATEAKLRERATTYWQAMQDGQYETTYALMDPFYRNKRDFRAYLSNKGAVKYHRYQIGQITQKGNIARVQVEIDVSVPEFKSSSGKTISQPLKTISFAETWVFVNNDWYREYYDEVAEKTFTRY
ncbi:MAG: sialidase family protein [Candidatus Competibacter sp.]